MTLPDWMTPQTRETRPRAPRPAKPAPTPTRLKATRERLDLAPTRMADYMGVPVHTYLKWESGQRAPNASALRLFDVLALIEAHAPALHAQLLEGGA